VAEEVLDFMELLLVDSIGSRQRAAGPAWPRRSMTAR